MLLRESKQPRPLIFNLQCLINKFPAKHFFLPKRNFGARCSENTGFMLLEMVSIQKLFVKHWYLLLFSSLNAKILQRTELLISQIPTQESYNLKSMKHGPIGFMMIRKWILYHLFLKSLLKEERFSSSKATPGKKNC